MRSAGEPGWAQGVGDHVACAEGDGFAVGAVRVRRLLGSSLFVATCILSTGMATNPGGCNSQVREGKYAGIYQCDTMVNGVSDCDNEVPGTVDTGTTGCSASLGTMLYCGYCEGAEPCRYCDPERFCPADPCSSQCPAEESETTYVCLEEGYPYLCNDVCCPVGFPVCCASRRWCGTSSDGCDEIDSQPSPGGGSGAGSSSGDCGIPAGGCAQMGKTDARFREGCCFGWEGCMKACADSCGYGWYETESQMYGPCQEITGSCITNAAQAAYNSC